ncbi:MAG: SGNH hydrolase domain-containing protein, partial [Microbacterium sp.]
ARAPTATGAGALGAAGLSHRFVDRPARTGTWLRSRPQRALALGAASVAVVSVIAASLPVAERQVETEWVAAAAALAHDGYAGAASEPSSAAETARGMTPSPSRAAEDEPQTLAPGCTGVPRSPTTPTCVGGDPNGDVRVALVGDSHAKQWATAVFAIAEERGWRVETYAHASCPFNVEERAVEAAGGVVCEGPNIATMAALLADPYDIVITANWAAGDFVESGTGQPPGVAGYAEVWNRLADAGSRVVVIKDVPKPRTHPLAADCLSVHYDDPASCGMPRDEALEGRDIVDRARVLAPRTFVVDITDRLCDETVCPAVIGNVVVYRDTNHLTDTFVRTLTPFIDARLPEELGRS